jgi:predicted amidohydrolase
MKVSVLQFKPKLLDKAHNLGRLSEMLAGIKTDLVVLPELATSGYVFNSPQEVLSIAEEAGNGESFELFSALAKEKDCSVVFGFPELDSSFQSPSSSFLSPTSSFLRKQESPKPNEIPEQARNEEINTPKLFNSCALINPDGTWKVYRKTHLFYREKLFFSPGDSGFFVCEAKDGVKIGMMICFDWQFPEAARTLALKGAQLICHPSNLVLPWCQQAMKTRSLENRVFSLTSNRIGKEGEGENELNFTGASQILNSKGELLASLSTTEEGITTVEIEPTEADNKQVTKLNNAFADRRPEFYNL